MATARITSTGALVEIAPAQSIWVTSTGALVEIAPAQSIWVTGVGAYIEYVVPWPADLPTGTYGPTLQMV